MTRQGIGSSPGAPRGVLRLAAAGGAALALVLLLVVCREPVHAALGWIDRLAPKPGLSGLALVVLSPVAFLALLGAVEWVLAGFGRSLQSVDGAWVPRDPRKEPR